MNLANPDHLTLFARHCEEFTFGSRDLDGLHARIRFYGRFIRSYWYVVFHPGRTPADSFHTLNHAIEGQTCPVTYDLPKGWRGGGA